MSRLFLLLSIAITLLVADPASGQSVIPVSVASGLSDPVAIEPAGDGSGRLFIAEQLGTIRIFSGNTLLATPYLDIQSLVGCCNERGLLGMAFHPNYASNGLFYVNYTDNNFDTVIASFEVSNASNLANPNSQQILLTIEQPFSNHNGGQLAFGPDGYLYIGTGDGGSGGDPLNNAQNPMSLLGKMLRIDVDNGAPYAIPVDNPFADDDFSRDEIWASGLRNPFRYSFDRVTGDLFIADVGQDLIEEVNLHSANLPSGQNYGWRLMEGSQCFLPANGCNEGSLTLPIFEYGHSNGRCSITGGYRYRGNAVPHMVGLYIYGDFCSGEIFAAQETETSWQQSVLVDTAFRISTFGQDESGELYVADLDGDLYRLAAPLSVAPGTGTYLTANVIDLSVIVRTQQGVSVDAIEVSLDGTNISNLFRQCAQQRDLADGGTSFTCPAVSLTVLESGVYTLAISLDTESGDTLTATVTWEILETL